MAVIGSAAQPALRQAVTWRVSPAGALFKTVLRATAKIGHRVLRTIASATDPNADRWSGA